DDLSVNAVSGENSQSARHIDRRVHDVGRRDGDAELHLAHFFARSLGLSGGRIDVKDNRKERQQGNYHLHQNSGSCPPVFTNHISSSTCIQNSWRVVQLWSTLASCQLTLALPIPVCILALTLNLS